MSDLPRASFISSATFTYEDILQLLEDPNFPEALLNFPSEVLGSLGAAVHNHLTKRSGQLLPKITARIVNYPTVIPIKNIKANMMNKLVCVRGTVVRVTNAKPIAKTMAFQCSKCGNVETYPLDDGKYVSPEACPLCKFKHFQPVKDMAKGCDWQRIKYAQPSPKKKKTSKPPAKHKNPTNPNTPHMQHAPTLLGLFCVDLGWFSYF